MKKSVLKIFDETIASTTVGAPSRFDIDPRWHDALAQFDKISYHLIVDDVQGGMATKTLSLDIEDSCDGRNWASRQTGVATASMTANQTTQGVGYDSTARFALAKVRAALTVTLAAAGQAHAVVYACCRDES
jgi:hypothetical protein